MTSKLNTLNFSRLVETIHQVDQRMCAQAGRAVNTSLTLRNWFIGFHIAEYELRGADRSNYGDNLLAALSEKLRGLKISNTGRRQLYSYLSFYRTYPQIVRALSAQSNTLIPSLPNSATLQKMRTPSAQFEIPPEKLLNTLSYSHFELLIEFNDPLKRTFYEIECIRGNWSVRTLKRQIASLYYERSGLSNNKEKLAELVQSGAERVEAKLAIQDPYIFEFLGIKSKTVMGEAKRFLRITDYAYALTTLAVSITGPWPNATANSRPRGCGTIRDLRSTVFSGNSKPKWPAAGSKSPKRRGSLKRRLRQITRRYSNAHLLDHRQPQRRGENHLFPGLSAQDGRVYEFYQCGPDCRRSFPFGAGTRAFGDNPVLVFEQQGEIRDILHYDYFKLLSREAGL